LEVGERVYNPHYGTGTVVYFQPGEFYPVQVELDKPCSDGHKMYRFAVFELKRLKQDEPRKLSGKFLARVAKPRRGYKLGDEYIIGPAKNPEYYNVYTMDGHIIGSYITNFFEIIRPIDGQEDKEPLKTQEMAQIEPEIKPAIIPLPEVKTAENEPKTRPKTRRKKRSLAEELEAAGQLNIFDFLEG
jgi:hypothetical protein